MSEASARLLSRRAATTDNSMQRCVPGDGEAMSRAAVRARIPTLGNARADGPGLACTAMTSRSSVAVDAAAGALRTPTAQLVPLELRQLLEKADIDAEPTECSTPRCISVAPGGAPASLRELPVATARRITFGAAGPRAWPQGKPWSNLCFSTVGGRRPSSPSLLLS